MVAVLAHLCGSLFCRPLLAFNSLDRNQNARPVTALPAMDEKDVVRVSLEHRDKVGDVLLVGAKEPGPRPPVKMNKVNAVAAAQGLLMLRLAVRGTDVNVVGDM